MANKRNWAHRNKKPNNWKHIAKIRKGKNEIVNSENNERENLPQSVAAYNSHDLGQNDVQLNDAPQSVNDENDDVYENTILIKRRRTDNREENSVPLASENFYAILSEDDDDHVSINQNEMIHNETVDPLSHASNSDDDEIDDGNNEQEEVGDEDIDREQDASDEDEDDEDRDETTLDGDASGEDDASIDDEEEVILEEKLNGRRIVEIGELFHQLKIIGRHSRNCSFDDMVLVSETIRGLNSILKFKCQKCGVVRKVETCPKKQNSLNINEAAVLGISSVGSGYSHLKEFFTQLNVPVMGNTLYDKIQKKQQSDWWNLAKESSLDALHEEIEFAKSIGSVDEKGNALIYVICDGSWGKRSYGKAFNSLSGCAVLIGVRTKKVVFFGVRNKYCHICKIAQSKCTPPNYHECTINYVGPSSGMESDIIVEGFKSCEEHKARFSKLICDGDSNTYKSIRDIRIYQNPDLFVEKCECVNHLHRNFRTKFTCLSKITKFDCDLRKHVKPSKGHDISKGIKKASKHWRESDLEITEKINRLEDDIMNAPAHYFGVHDKCQSYFCNKTTDQRSIDNLQLLMEDGLYYEVLNLCQTYFAGHAKSLLDNYTNNPAEEFNNVVAKYLGGKRINYSLARSYTARVAAAVVQCNSGGHAGSEFHKYKYINPEISNIEKLENNRKRKLGKNEAARKVKPRIQRVVQSKSSTGAGVYLHGDGCEHLDMDPAKFEKAKKVLLEKLKYNQRNRQSVEKSTIGGKINNRWQVIRRDLLPSSFFQRIIKTKQRKTYTKVLEELMFKRSEFGNSAEIKHQRLVVRDALKVFKELFNDHPLVNCGIFIDKELPFLCTSPFKLYGNDHILMVKCPLRQYKKKFDDVINKIPFWKNEAGIININHQSDWYFELQCELHITRRKYGFIMVWLGDFEGEPQYRIVEVPKDDSVLEKHKPKLIYFYNEVMLKELVDSRIGRNMKLREYNVEEKSFI